MNNPKEDVNKLIMAVGAAAEMVGLMRTQLINNGFTREEAVYMCTEVLGKIFNVKE